MTAERSLLALETSGKSGSVALATIRGQGSLAIEQEVLDPEWGSARTLAPAIAKVLERLQVTPRTLHAIAVVQGPGSFTGLRVGAATAKTMAWALGIPLIAVDALDCVARQVSKGWVTEHRDVPSTLVVVSDAYRGQVFRAVYQWTASGIVPCEPTGIEDLESVAQRFFMAQKSQIFVAGPGFGKVLTWCERQCSTSAQAMVQVVEGPESVPMASTVAELGWERWERGETEEVLGFLPKYYRGSAAEEKKKESGTN